MQLYENIKRRRNELNMTQTELAQKTGYSDKSMIAKIEKGTVDIPISKIDEFAKALRISPGDLMGSPEKNPTAIILEVSSRETKTQAIRIPVLGDVAAGIPLYAVENIIDYEEIPAGLANQGQFFGLRIKGDSMEPRICDGDVVIVKKQEDADSGDIVIACINGDSATCKRLVRYPDQIILMPLNSKYDPIVFTMDDVKNAPLTIIGKVIELRGKF